MASFVSEILSQIILAPLTWFSELMEKSSQQSFYISMVFLFLLSNRILKPIFGSAGSDKVKKPRPANKDTEG